MAAPSIISRYVFKECAFFVAIALFAFTAILFTVKLLNFASLVINKGVSATQVATIFLTITPTFLELAIPLATLLGVMLGIARLCGDSEVIVMRASGIKQLALMRPIILLGCTTAIVGLLVSHFLKPWGYRTLNSTLLEIAQAKSTSSLTGGVFNNLGPLTLYAEEISDQTGDLRKVLIDDRRDIKARQIITSESGNLFSNPQDGSIELTLQNGVSHSQAEGKYTITRFDSNKIILNAATMYDPNTAHSGIRTRELYLFEINNMQHELRLIRKRIEAGEVVEKDSISKLAGRYFGGDPINLKETRQRQRKCNLEMIQRYSLPCASLILALIGIPLGIHPPRFQRTWGAGLSTMIAIVVFTIYYGFVSFGMTFAERGSMNPYLALWGPNLILLTLGIYLINNISRERWSSVGEGLHFFIRKLSWR